MLPKSFPFSPAVASIRTVLPWSVWRAASAS